MVMTVADMLRVKGSVLHTTTPEHTLAQAMQVMDDNDIGSLVVMANDLVVGMLTFREVIRAINKNGGQVQGVTVYRAMDNGPLICTPATDVNEVRRMMLSTHARYMPVIEQNRLIGVISFYDVAKSVVEAQDFENKLLKAYIRDWPQERTCAAESVANPAASSTAAAAPAAAATTSSDAAAQG